MERQEAEWTGGQTEGRGRLEGRAFAQRRVGCRLKPTSDVWPQLWTPTGSFLVPYVVMLVVEGMPLLYLELAVGQHMRRGSVGAWMAISPYLSGVGKRVLSHPPLRRDPHSVPQAAGAWVGAPGQAAGARGKHEAAEGALELGALTAQKAVPQGGG